MAMHDLKNGAAGEVSRVRRRCARCAGPAMVTPPADDDRDGPSILHELGLKNLWQGEAFACPLCGNRVGILSLRSRVQVGLIALAVGAYIGHAAVRMGAASSTPDIAPDEILVRLAGFLPPAAVLLSCAWVTMRDLVCRRRHPIIRHPIIRHPIIRHPIIR